MKSTKVKIIDRPLTHTEAEEFSQEIKHTPNITGYKPSELVRLKNVSVLEVSNRTAGMLAYVEVNKFIDLKILLIKRSYRGHGYGNLLMSHAIELLKTKKPIYAVTKNPIIVHMLTAIGFKKVLFFQLPLSCMLHQARMAFSIYRIKETIRKMVRFPNQGHFEYYIKFK